MTDSLDGRYVPPRNVTDCVGVAVFFQNGTGFLYSRDLGRVFVGFREAKLTEAPLAGQWFRFSACRRPPEQRFQRDVLYEATSAERIDDRMDVVKRTEHGVELAAAACCGAVWLNHAYMWNEHLGKLAYSGPKLDCLAPSEMVDVTVGWERLTSKGCYWIVTAVLGASDAKRPSELKVVTAEAAPFTLKVAPYHGPQTLRLRDFESRDVLLVVPGDWNTPIINFGDVAAQNEGCFDVGRRFTVCAAPRAICQGMSKVIYCAPNDGHKSHVTASAPKAVPEIPPTERRKLWIGSLPLEATRYDLRNLFSKFGVIVDAYVGNSSTQRCSNKKFGFVVFESANSCDDCIAAAPFRFKDNDLIVEHCRSDTREFRTRNSSSVPANSPLLAIPSSFVEQCRPASTKSATEPASSSLIASPSSSVAPDDQGGGFAYCSSSRVMTTAEKEVQTETSTREDVAESRRKTKAILKRLMELDGVSSALTKMQPDLLKDIILFMASD